VHVLPVYGVGAAVAAGCIGLTCSCVLLRHCAGLAGAWIGLTVQHCGRLQALAVAIPAAVLAVVDYHAPAALHHLRQLLSGTDAQHKLHTSSLLLVPVV
jgi:hypothetical protein